MKVIREKINYSQTYLAQELGISQKAYSKIETGETKLTVDNLFRIASALETTVYELLNTDSFNIYNNYHTHNGEGISINKQISEKPVHHPADTLLVVNVYKKIKFRDKHRLI